MKKILLGMGNDHKGAKLPPWVKSEHVEGPFFDEFGGEYMRVTIKFRWWYVPIAWFNMWRSRPVAPTE